MRTLIIDDKNSNSEEMCVRLEIEKKVLNLHFSSISNIECINYKTIHLKSKNKSRKLRNVLFKTEKKIIIRLSIFMNFCEKFYRLLMSS